MYLLATILYIACIMNFLIIETTLTSVHSLLSCKCLKITFQFINLLRKSYIKLFILKYFFYKI
ncbi:hypothetical protein A0H76_1893 [Hepatospora eriocheir]|uniref:Uncharacterized protein n=1 Tax=Hepatospora eriocheir TaxID=1081669 RepID=A0A1X0QGA7_9MICR|nr:hypothetical protein A0H76_1893 [Hepatospora eriocheir]